MQKNCGRQKILTIWYNNIIIHTVSDLHIVYGEVTVNASRIIDKSDNGAASMRDRKNLGALGHLSDRRDHHVKIASAACAG